MYTALNSELFVVVEPTVYICCQCVIQVLLRRKCITVMLHMQAMDREVDFSKILSFYFYDNKG